MIILTCLIILFLYCRNAYHYITTIVRKQRYQYECIPVRLPNDQELTYEGNITYLHSPGYPTFNYPPRRLSYYHVKCNNNVQFIIVRFQLQPPIRVYRQGKICVDYVSVTGRVLKSDRKSSKERCGHLEPSDVLFDIYSGNVLVTFRSSRFNNYRGFRIAAVCIDASEQDQPGCLQLDQYLRMEGYAESDMYSDEFMVRVEEHSAIIILLLNR